MIKKSIFALVIALMLFLNCLVASAKVYNVTFRRGAPVQIEVPAKWTVRETSAGVYLDFKKGNTSVTEICVMSDSRPYKSDQSISELYKEFMATAEAVQDLIKMNSSSLSSLTIAKTKIYFFKQVSEEIVSYIFLPHDQNTIYPVQLMFKNADTQMQSESNLLIQSILQKLIRK